MTYAISLYTKMLKYEPDIVLFTALSGPVEGILSHYLVIEGSDGFYGVSETRANMEYYNGLPAHQASPVIRQFVEQIDWSRDADEIMAIPSKSEGSVHPIARCAVESALVDGVARRRRISVAELLGGHWRSRVPSNNSLMWSSFDRFKKMADRFVKDGFRSIKVRIAIATFDEDLVRVKHVLERCRSCGAEVGVDVNGKWSVEEAIENIRTLQTLGIGFVEQPIRPWDWEGLTALKNETAVPIVVDEGCQSSSDVARLATYGKPFMAHLKMLKLGGPIAMVEAARMLTRNGVVPFIGQMNEGMAATALAAQCGMAVESQGPCELYGFYGLLEEPVSGLRYQDGDVVFASAIATGFEFDRRKATHVWSVQT